MSVICRKFLLKLALRTYIFLKLSHASTLSVWTEEIQAKTGEWTKQTAIYCDTFWLDHLTHVIVLFANAKIYVTVQFLLRFILDLRTISEYRPPGVDLEARFVGFLRYEFGGLMHGEVIFGILRYILIWWKMNELSPPVKRAVKNLLYGQKENFFLRH